MQNITFLSVQTAFHHTVFIDTTQSRLYLRISNHLPSKKASKAACELIKYYAQLWTEDKYVLRLT